MKNKAYENFLDIILKVPTVEKCDLINKLDKEITVDIELQDGFSFITTIHLLKNGYPKQISELSTHLNDVGYHIVAAPFISNGAEDVCRSMNIGYIDTAGNCLFQYHSLYINISGNKNKEVPKCALKSIFERSSIVSSKILREMYQDIDKSIVGVRHQCGQPNVNLRQVPAQVND